MNNIHKKTTLTLASKAWQEAAHRLGVKAFVVFAEKLPSFGQQTRTLGLPVVDRGTQFIAIAKDLGPRQKILTLLHEVRHLQRGEFMSIVQRGGQFVFAKAVHIKGQVVDEEDPERWAQWIMAQAEHRVSERLSPPIPASLVDHFYEQVLGELRAQP
jgi:hypothetical protein